MSGTIAEEPRPGNAAARPRARPTPPDADSLDNTLNVTPFAPTSGPAARGLYVTEPEFGNLDAAVAKWAETAVPLIRRALAPEQPEGRA